MSDKEKVLKAGRRKRTKTKTLYAKEQIYKRVYFLVDFMKAEDNGSVS